MWRITLIVLGLLALGVLGMAAWFLSVPAKPISLTPNAPETTDESPAEPQTEPRDVPEEPEPLPIPEEKPDPVPPEDLESPQDEESETAPREMSKDTAADIAIVDKLVSWGHQSAQNRTIDTVIIHSSYNALEGDEYDTEAIVDIYRDYGVAAHYIINREGEIWQLVEEKDIAYHAGVSSLPDGRTNVNAVSLGIELVGNLEDGFTNKQYDALNNLLEDIVSRHDIVYTLGHDDIAPDRKSDPWNFDWERITD